MNTVFRLSVTSLFVTAAMTANAGINIVDGETGNFSIGGNVELNFNYQQRDSNAQQQSEFNQDGRVLIEFAGEKYSDNGYFVGVKTQPLFESTGNIALDDAYFEFGKLEAWKVTAGRFEAYDMFPVGLDVFLEYSGNTSNELYSNDSAYVYQMKEARGRGSDGQLMYNQTFGNWYVELGTMFGDRSGLFAGETGVDKTYHGQVITQTKDSFYVRPVVAYQTGDFTFAAALETNLVSNAAVTSNGVDVSDRTGYGVTGNWQSGNTNVNANVSYMDAVDEDNLSAGLNLMHSGFGIGYVYANNDYDSTWAKGNVTVNTTYASYEFTNVLVDDFSVLLGTYYTTINNDTNNQSAYSEDDDFGARVRLFYAF
ncbi:porin [Vibrio sp. qd031]|uniref:carbohydrate porin n=1 Tax=Vibrio sp. qd031 TaxID=1603038 RepID=UPI000A11223B|nr:carbohydrate porin [Vibrio sp. qd031]ORT49587.1 porin [Vibrio sp. qd031]